MLRPDFARLQRRLADLGVTPANIRRTLDELEDHYEDLQQEALREGRSRVAASSFATRKLGNVNDLAVEIAARPELRRWPYRHPRLARFLLPVAWFVMLPTVPLYAGVANASSIGRWGASLMLAAAVTASMFLVLQISIAFS